MRDLIGFGGVLLSRGLSQSTIGAAGLNVRVREGIGCLPRAMTTKPEQITFFFEFFALHTSTLKVVLTFKAHESIARLFGRMLRRFCFTAWSTAIGAKRVSAAFRACNKRLSVAVTFPQRIFCRTSRLEFYLIINAYFAFTGPTSSRLND